MPQPKPQPKERRLTPPFVALLVGYSTRRLQQLCENGTLEANRAGGTGYWQIKPESICKVFNMTPKQLRDKIRRASDVS